MPKLTLAQEYQTLLYGLFQQHLLNLEGPVLTDPETQQPIVHVSKDVMLDKVLLVLNEFGEAVKNDERFKHEAQ